MKGAGTGVLGGWGDPNALTQWMVVGPFQSERAGQMGDTVYPPERRLDVAAEVPGGSGKVKWQPYVGAYVDFAKLYGNSGKGVAYAVAVLRAKKATPVSITFGGIAFLNGERLGVPFRAGNNEVPYTLQEGDNVLLIAAPEPGKNWGVSARVQVAASAAPGDVRAVPADKLSEVPVLRPAPLPSAPEGAGLPFSDGKNWKLVYEDDFNRSRIGTDWIPSAEAHWGLADGHLAAGGAFEYLTLAQNLKGPVRVECDLTGAPKHGRNWILGFTLTPRKEVEGRALWYDTKGAGYMLAVGWHDRISNELWRQEKELQVSTKGPFTEDGRTRHVIAQWAAPHLLLALDGQVSLDQNDADWLPGLDTFSFFSAWSKDFIDNVRVYTAAE